MSSKYTLLSCARCGNFGSAEWTATEQGEEPELLEVPNGFIMIGPRGNGGCFFACDTCRTVATEHG